MYPDEIALGECSPDETPSSYALPAAADAALEARERLLERLRDDPATVFDELFATHQSLVFQLAYRILGDRDEALDVSQDVFLAVYRKLPHFRGEASLKTWLYKITVNRCANRCRWWNRLRRRGTVSLDTHLGRGSEHGGADLVPAGRGSPEQDLLARERQAEIARSLLELPVHQRVAVVMRDVEGLAYEDIAAATGVSLGTVKSRIARGRDELKRRLNGALGPASAPPESS